MAILAALASGAGADSTFAPLARVVEDGIDRGIYPGAVVVVGRRDTVLYAEGFGHTTWTGPDRPDPRETRWDLASLTKVVATTSAMLVLADQGRVAIDAPVSRYLPRFRGGGRNLVTVRMLLDHSSGLPPYLRLYRAKSRQAALDILYQVPLRHRPGRVTEYSDLNAMLLGLLIERVTGRSLDRFAAEAVFDPLGMRGTSFAPALPRGAPVAPSRRVGCCPAPGRVDDDNAFFLGGVAGHAGLFSTGADLARFVQTWLGTGDTWVSPRTFRQFLARAGSASGPGRVLGWDTPGFRAASHQAPVFGASICGCGFGQTGWTGTMLWADPDRDLFLVFLTNRSLEPRVRNSIAALHQVRRELSERVLALGEMGK